MPTNMFVNMEVRVETRARTFDNTMAAGSSRSHRCGSLGTNRSPSIDPGHWCSVGCDSACARPRLSDMQHSGCIRVRYRYAEPVRGSGRPHL